MSTSVIKSSGGDYTSLSGWQTGVSGSGNDETASIQENYDAQSTNLTMSMTGHAYTITADASHAVNAPTYAVGSARARWSAGVTFTGTSWTIEKVGLIGNGTTQPITCNCASGVFAIRRCWGYTTSTYEILIRCITAASQTVTISNLAISSDSSAGSGGALRHNQASSTMTCYHVSGVSVGTLSVFVQANGTLNAYASVQQGVGAFKGGTVGGDENVSQGTDAVGTTAWKSQTDVFTSTTAGSEDLSMAAGPYAVTDRSGTLSDLATDLKGTARVVLIDAGCDYIAPDSSALTTSLNAYYRMDEASGNRSDSSGNGLTLTDNNTIASTTGHLGANCADFTAANSEFGNHADASAYAFTTKLSINGWLYKDANSANESICGQWTYQTDGSWQLMCDSAGALFIYLATTSNDAGNTSGKTGNTFFSTGSWHMFTVTYDGSVTGNASRLRLFLDGCEKEIATFNGTIPSSLLDSAGDFVVGEFAGLGRYWDSKMEHIGLWALQLSNAKIKALWNSGTGKDPTAGASSIKTFQGLARASVKTVGGLALASVKTWNGLA